ncbi:MAG: class IV adenylate cyclase [Elusimicrobia bacterium]|nr:class IV adenylate cyclase [Elusimicrobiota bacterium]
MARNVELKARVSDWDAVVARARRLWGEPTTLIQRDVFFAAPKGRLKLRIQEPGPSYLIYYDRPDAAGPKTSEWLGADVADAAAARALLAKALGELKTVEKTRLLFMAGRTRIHLDDVSGLGRFLELEVVLLPDEPSEAGQAEAGELLKALGVPQDALLAGAYADL